MLLKILTRATLSVVLSLATCTSALPGKLGTHVRRQSTVPVPADDPFYSAPVNVASKAPGTVLRSRSIQASFFSDVPDPVEAWQVLYRTTAINGTALAAVTTIFKPLTPNLMLDRFVSYASAYDSSATQCDPSYAYRLGSDSSDNSDTDAEFLIIEGYLLQGYVVSSPDYEGPDAAFGPGHLEGVVLLDSLRAVTNFGKTIGFNTPAPAIFAHGYSGGAIATGWAASLQPSYAPELPIKGWAHGGTPANLTGVTVYIANTTFSGFLPAAVAGLASPTAYYTQLAPVLQEILTTKGKSAVEYVQTHCMSDDLSEYPFTSLLSYEFQTLGPALLQNTVIENVLQQNILGLETSETPEHPVLVVHATQDEIIPFANASSLVDRWCSRGANVTFTKYEKGGHVTTAVVSVPEVYAYAQRAFAGTIKSGCSTNSVFSSILNPVGLAVELEPILIQLANLLGSMGSDSEVVQKDPSQFFQ